MPQESKLTPELLDAMLQEAVASGNRLEVDEPMLVMPASPSPTQNPAPKPRAPSRA